MRKAIDQDTLSALVETGAMREFRATRKGMAGRSRGGSARAGYLVRSRREPVRNLGQPDRCRALLRQSGHSRSLTVEL